MNVIEATRAALKGLREDDLAACTNALRQAERVFVLGLGGSAAMASHFAADLRNLCRIAAFSPDSVSLWTALANDQSWNASLAEWLRAHRLAANDEVFILSVGGGSVAQGVSVPLTVAMDYANRIDAGVMGIATGGDLLDRGYSIVVPVPDPELRTFVTESVHAVVCHELVRRLAVKIPKWESLS